MINGSGNFECVLLHDRFVDSESRGSLNLNGITVELVIGAVKLSSKASLQIMGLLLVLEIFAVLEIVPIGWDALNTFLFQKVTQSIHSEYQTQLLIYVTLPFAQSLYRTFLFQVFI